MECNGPACLSHLQTRIRADATVWPSFEISHLAWPQPGCLFKFKFRLSTRMSCPSNCQCLLVIWLVGLRVAASARRPDQPEAWTRILRPFGRHRTGTGFIGSLQFVHFRYKIVESAISFEISHLTIFIIVGACPSQKKVVCRE